MSAANQPQPGDTPGMEYVYVVARPEIGNRVALWERDPAHPNGEVIVEGAAPGQPAEAVRVARTGAVNDRLHPNVGQGGTLVVVDGERLAAIQDAFKAHQENGELRARQSLENRARSGDTAAALLLQLQGNGSGSGEPREVDTQGAQLAAMQAAHEAQMAELHARLDAQEQRFAAERAQLEQQQGQPPATAEGEGAGEQQPPKTGRGNK